MFRILCIMDEALHVVQLTASPASCKGLQNSLSVSQHHSDGDGSSRHSSNGNAEGGQFCHHALERKTAASLPDSLGECTTRRCAQPSPRLSMIPVQLFLCTDSARRCSLPQADGGQTGRVYNSD